MRTQRLLKIFVAVGVCGMSVLAACSLGLDASKLTVADEAGVNPTVDAGPDVPLKPGEIRCQSKQDCNDGGCLEGDCIGGVCKYEVCPTGEFPCQHRACVDNKCTQPSPHHFVAQHLVLGTAGLGCNDSLGACVAVSYPFAFVGPKTGDVAAYPLTDLASSADGGFAPTAVKLQNLTFRPTRIIANHDRVWLIGPVATRGSTREVPVAWIEVPTNPQVSTLPVSSGTLTLPSTGDIAGAVPGANKGLIVLLGDGTPIPRAAQLGVLDGGVNSDTTFNLLADYDGGAPIVAASGDRLITARFESGPPAVADPVVYNMNIIANAGAASAATLGEVNFAAPFGKLYNGVTFAETPKGSVIAQGAIAAVEDGGVLGVDSIRVAWVIEGADGKLRGANPLGGVPVIQYVDGGLPQTPPTIGPITAVGDDAIFALQGEGDAGTSVRVVRRNPTNPTIATNDNTSQTSLGQPPFTYVIAGAVSEVTSKLYGYAFTKPNDEADGVHVTVFELGCGQ